jgi:hypothetical protein
MAAAQTPAAEPCYVGQIVKKRDALWESIWADDGETVAWPAEADARERLASRILGVTVIGAAEHVLTEALEKADGVPPKPGTDDYRSRLRESEVLKSLSAEQREVVKGLIRETAYFSLYWPFAKAGHLPGVELELTLRRSSEDGSPDESFNLTSDFGPHVLLLEWTEEFGDVWARPANQISR